MAKRRIALIIETSSSYGRGLLAGIMRFRRTHPQWSVFLDQRDLPTEPPGWLKTWKGDGIISRATTRKFAEAIAATGVPLVELTDRWADLGFPSVRSNDVAIGELAATHLAERGFRHVAFCGFEQEAWSTRRGNAFREAVARDDNATECQAYSSPWYGNAVLPWEEEQRRISQWLKELPKPVGVFASNDIRGQHVLEAALSAGLNVPEEVAVIGVDNDDILCQLCNPPMSSVKPNVEMIGMNAAEMLASLMDGQQASPHELIIEPLGIATRQSTDIVAVEDPDIAAALAFIREHACQGISVQDVLDRVAVSRSTLERQLRTLLKRSPQQEIRRVQIQRAKELCSSTDLAVERIAITCGFEHPEYMHVVFKREVGMTPGEYRKKTQPG